MRKAPAKFRPDLPQNHHPIRHMESSVMAEQNPSTFGWLKKLFGGGSAPQPERAMGEPYVTWPTRQAAEPEAEPVEYDEPIEEAEEESELIDDSEADLVYEKAISEESAAVPEPAPVPEPAAAEPDPLGDFIALHTAGADFVFLPKMTAAGDAPAPQQKAQSSTDTPSDGHVLLHLSNGAANASAGGATGGYSIRVPDSFEAAASGKRAKIVVLARAPMGAARFAVAYSTNEVGNSGWRWFKANSDWAAYEFHYPVPTMKNGHGDFIGILPSPAGEPGIEVCAAAATVLY